MMHLRHRLRIVVGLVVLLAASIACNLTNLSDTATSADPAERPLVLLLAPVNGETYAEGVPIVLQAYAHVNSGSVARIEFRVDDLPVGEQSATDPQAANALRAGLTWTAQGQSGHLITVEAFGQDGASLGLADATIRVVANPLAQLPTSRTLTSDPAGDATGPDSDAADPTPILTLTPVSAAPALSGPLARVNTAELNVRQGPAPTYPVVGMLLLNDPVEIVGRSANGDWWAIAYRGGTAWVFADLVTPEEDVSQVPLVAAP